MIKIQLWQTTIRKYDADLGKVLSNLYTAVLDCKVKNSIDSDVRTDMLELMDKLALDTYRILKKNERRVAEEKADDLYTQCQGVAEYDGSGQSEAWQNYYDACTDVDELRAQEEELDNHITAQMFGQYAH